MFGSMCVRPEKLQGFGMAKNLLKYAESADSVTNHSWSARYAGTRASFHFLKHSDIVCVMAFVQPRIDEENCESPRSIRVSIPCVESVHGRE
jgi:hypothetical protein